MTSVDATMTKSGGKICVELHTPLAEDWFDAVVDDYVALGGGVYLVDHELGEALAEAMRAHGLEVEDEAVAARRC